jgi:hypothetical protein
MDLVIDYSAARMRALADDLHNNLENKEVDEYLKRIVAAATGGAFHIMIRDNLTELQIARFNALGYSVCEMIKGHPSTYRICWSNPK